MDHCTTFVGIDAHKESLCIAVLPPGIPCAETLEIKNDARLIRRWAQKLQRGSASVLCAYEAGPLGYSLQRQLNALGLPCQVIAPSLIPVKPGERIKTDRRDARKLVELLRAGMLTEVHPPTPEQESVRDLCRARHACRKDLARCRHRVVKFLLRRGIRWTVGRKAWTKAYCQWLRNLRMDHALDQDLLEDYWLAVEQVDARLSYLEQKLKDIGETGEYREPVAWLRCMRGIDTVTAMTIVAELHDIRRFKKPRALMAYLGLVPSEHSSGDRQRRGGITKAGNHHVRRVLIEAAWHYRHRPKLGLQLRRRREGQPAPVIAIADKAQQRLCRRYYRLTCSGRSPNKAVTAVARELIGFIWAILNLERHQVT